MRVIDVLFNLIDWLNKFILSNYRETWDGIFLVFPIHEHLDNGIYVEDNWCCRCAWRLAGNHDASIYRGLKWVAFNGNLRGTAADATRRILSFQACGSNEYISDANTRDEGNSCHSENQLKFELITHSLYKKKFINYNLTRLRLVLQIYTHQKNCIALVS